MLWVQFALQHTQTFHGWIRVKDKSILFLCYIDDVFMVWTKSEKIAEWFYDWTEPKHPSVKSDHEFDSKQIQFLDILAYIDQQNKLQATLFWNQLTVKSSLIQNQNILTHLKSILYGKALRIQVISSTFQDYHSHSRKLIEKFVGSQQQTQIIDQLNRKQLLHQQKWNDK